MSNHAAPRISFLPEMKLLQRGKEAERGEREGCEREVGEREEMASNVELCSALLILSLNGPKPLTFEKNDIVLTDN